MNSKDIFKKKPDLQTAPSIFLDLTEKISVFKSKQTVIRQKQTNFIQTLNTAITNRTETKSKNIIFLIRNIAVGGSVTKA